MLHTAFTEIPDDLGFDAAWLGRDVLLALLPRHQPLDAPPELPMTAPARPAEMIWNLPPSCQPEPLLGLSMRGL